MFPTVTVAGVEHLMTPSPKRLDDFLTPALQVQGLGTWHDAGASTAIMPSIKDWWPEPPCPVETAVTDDDSEDVQADERWPGLFLYGDNDTKMASFLENYPDDADEIRAYFRWQHRRKERSDALQAIRMAVEAAGKLRRLHILQDVVAELESQMPGFVGQMVTEHCAVGHMCCMAEHDAKGMV